jgi:dipeptidyl aminopeptidase/acylaminoacyl peptidase
MPFAQSEELHRAYQSAGRPVQLLPIPGGAHGGKEFFDETRLKLVTEFLRDHGLAPAAAK